MRMNEAVKKKLLRRLAIVRGQVNGLEKMIQQDKYCVDIITQSSAIRQALSGVEDLMLENHLSTHVAHQMKTGDDKKATAEVVKVFKLAKQR